MASRMVTEFLDRVWGDQQAFVDLPSIVRVKGEARWIPFTIEWPNLEGATRRIGRCVDDEEDVYFSPCMFLDSERRADLALPTRWLWADIDHMPLEKAVDFLEVDPTICWRTSHGRYQALWQCKQLMHPPLQQAINQALTRKLGADLGGWDITQVLRIPGTYNFKHTENGARGAEVYIKWADGPVYDVRDLLAKLGLRAKDLRPSVSSVGEGEAHDQKSAVDGARRQLPRRARTLLKAPARVGERSHVLFKVWQLLLADGWSEDAAVAAVIKSGSELNKWKENDDGGAARLGQDYRRAAIKGTGQRSGAASGGTNGASDESDGDARDHRGSEDQSNGSWKWEDYGTFMKAKFPRPRWLIEDIWTAGSHGIIAGDPKTMKSTVAMCMGMAVASGQPLWGRFMVPRAGPVLFVQEENDRGMVQDRLRKIAASMDLLEGKLKRVTDVGAVGKRQVTNIDFRGEHPLSLLNHHGVNLDDTDHCHRLEQKIAEVKPLLVVLDPLYWMLGNADENNVSQLRPFLKWLKELTFTHGCALAIVHHYRKRFASPNGGVGKIGKGVSLGQQLRGSSVFWAWFDCALFLEEMEQKGRRTKLRMDRQFRRDAPKAALEIMIAMGTPGDLEFDASVIDFSKEGQIWSIVGDKGMLVSKIAKELGMDKRTVKKYIVGGESLRLDESGAWPKAFRA